MKQSRLVKLAIFLVTTVLLSGCFFGPGPGDDRHYDHGDHGDHRDQHEHGDHEGDRDR
jgi:hypothetical protein